MEKEHWCVLYTDTASQNTSGTDFFSNSHILFCIYHYTITCTLFIAVDIGIKLCGRVLAHDCSCSGAGKLGNQASNRCGSFLQYRVRNGGEKFERFSVHETYR